MRLSCLVCPALILATLTGCSSLAPRDFAGTEPTFDPMAFFTGATKSSGVLENRGGAPMERVETETHGHLESGILQLEQELLFRDGKHQHRSWRIRRVDRHHFEATANDVIGLARGEAYGNVFHWSFTLTLSAGNSLTHVQMTQWMYLQPGGRTMVNHTTIRKFGFVVAQVTEEFRRP